MRRILLPVIALVSLNTVAALGQVGTGNIRGTVTDARPAARSLAARTFAPGLAGSTSYIAIARCSAVMPAGKSRMSNSTPAMRSSPEATVLAGR